MVVLLLALSGTLGAQESTGTDANLPGEIDLDAARARDEFRWGVGAFHDGRYADAIVAFVRTLAFKPENVLYREWLGRAYYQSGLIDAALSEWDSISSQVGAYLLGQIDTIRYRRGTLSIEREPVDYAVSTVFQAVPVDTRIFQRPVSLFPEPDGSILVTSLAGQEILSINPNGIVGTRLRGGLVGLDKPFDIVRLQNGDVLVSEFGADRISRLTPEGNRNLEFGETGLGDGTLLGPQYLAVDDTGSIFVSDWGGRRVVKFSGEGTFLLSFGKPLGAFSGFERPTGLLWFQGSLWVADNTRSGAVLHRFDGSGNFLDTRVLPLDREIRVEDLEVDRYDRFIVAAGEAVYLYDPHDEVIRATLDDGGRKRVTSAIVDANGRIAVADFDADEVVLFTPESALYSGLDVHIHRIIGRRYPTIGVEVSVRDRTGEPIVGLTAENFIVSEQGIPISDIALDAAGYVSDVLDMSVVIDTAIAEDEQGREAVQDVLRDLYAYLGEDDSFRLYVTESEPQLLLEKPVTSERIAAAVEEKLTELYRKGQHRPEIPEQTIHLAVSELVNKGLRREVVYVTDGNVVETAFDRYNLEELSWYMVNNGITFSVVMTVPGSIDPALDYLVDHTGGRIRYVYEPNGIYPMVDELRRQRNGRYWLVYESISDTDFGRAFIPVSIESRLEIRSGRDELGFYGPSQ